MNGVMYKIGETVRGRIANSELYPVENEIRKYILKEFSKNGRAPTPEEIMADLGISSIDLVNQTIEKLVNLDIILKKGQTIVSAYPFSALETPHKVIFEDGHEVYALCATDAFGIHFMLNQDITIRSRCPKCEREIKIVVKGGQITSRNPRDIIEFMGAQERCGCTAETLCPFINFFCSRRHLEKLRKTNTAYETGEVYSLTEAMEHGRVIFGDFLK